MTQQMTTKVAPVYDGRTSFFACEDAIDDWCDITELEAERRGPALRNRLEGDAAQYKRLLDRELLKDPVEGVNYSKRFLRPHLSREPKLCSCTGSCNSLNTTEAQWIYKD